MVEADSAPVYVRTCLISFPDLCKQLFFGTVGLQEEYTHSNSIIQIQNNRYFSSFVSVSV